MKPYEIVESELTYKGRILDVKVDTIALPNGKTAKREVVLHNGGSAIIPVDKEGNIYFVRQYRHPTNRMILEIPAGMVEKGEDPIACAARELEEEIGQKSDDISLLTSIYSSVGYTTEIIHIYKAENLYEGEQNLDEDEFINIEKYHIDEAVEMIASGKIMDAKTIVAVLAYKNFFAS